MDDHEAAQEFGGSGHSIPMDRFAWERCVRRASLAPELKYVALVMATWAGKGGREVRPGDHLLADVCGKGLRTVVRNRRELMRLGWLEQLPKARRADAHEYQLTVPAAFVDDPSTQPPEPVDKGGPRATRDTRSPPTTRHP
ncbi:hypothetical protein ASD11_07295 [Aeromicrobium sp. Root495]|nr:hypothetical protein ASD11_07295 [Aeromicrobium sp. Root495]